MSLSIHHLDCNYTVPRNGERVAARLDHAAMTELPSALQRRVDEDDTGGALCFIERMEIETVLDATANDYGLAQRWAESLWTAVVRRLRGGDGVIAFRQRSEYVSAFVLDLLDGAAESIWYYRELLTDGLSAADQAVRVLAAFPDAGRDALIDIERQGRLREVLRWLDARRVEEVVAACLLPPSPDFVAAGSPRRWLDAIRSRRFIPTGHVATDTAILYLQLLHDSPELGPDVNLARFVANILDVARIDAIAPLLRDDDWTSIRAKLSSVEQARFLRTLLQSVAPAEVARVVEELQPAQSDSYERIFATEHAGVFLLASSVLDLELPEQPDDGELPTLLFFVIVQCLGRRDDRTIAAFCGLGREPEEEVDALLIAPLANALMKHFERRLGAFAGSSAEYLYRNFLRSDGVVSVSAQRMDVRFLTCPMRVVLRMAGFGSAPLALPWAGGTLLELHLD